MNIKTMLGSSGVTKEACKSAELRTDYTVSPDEYPRPQLQRSSYICLNGKWDYSFAKDNTIPEHYEGQINVPFSPESSLSGVNRQLQPDEFLWYKRTFNIDSINSDSKLILHFGAVDQVCQIYINGNSAGSHSGGYLPFETDITDHIHVGNNDFIVCVTDSTDTSYHMRGKQSLHNGGIFYTGQSGIWQTVWMEWVPEHYISSLRITPLYDIQSVHIQLLGDLLNEDITYDICYKNKQLFSDTCAKTEVTIPISELHAWSPDSPDLYDIVIHTAHDTIKSYFAMRIFTVEKDSKGINRLCLNHKPYYQNGILDQGYWPDSLMTPVSDEAMIYDITQMKSLGFNMLRKHCKVEPLRWYYHCDRLGMLVWQDIPNGGTRYNMLKICYLPTLLPHWAKRHRDNRRYSFSSRKEIESRQEWHKECSELINTLYNCPCICSWVLFNEGWGQFDADNAVKDARLIDNTRFIDQASGWFDQGSGDMRSVHNYFRKLKVEKDTRPFVISEYGGYAHLVKGHSYSDHMFGYRKFTDQKEFASAFDKLVNHEIPALIDQGLSAAVYTQLSDVEEEVNGLLTYDRKVNKITTRS